MSSSSSEKPQEWTKTWKKKAGFYKEESVDESESEVKPWNKWGWRKVSEPSETFSEEID